MAGYSDTPLAKKLGLTTAQTGLLLHAPTEYADWLPDYVHALHAAPQNPAYNWIHAFYIQRPELEQELTTLKQHLEPSGQLWISWPKKSSGILSDLDENIIRQLGLEAGLVDVKVAAISDVWSGLKFVYRLKDRA